MKNPTLSKDFSQTITRDYVENVLLPACDTWTQIGTQVADLIEVSEKVFEEGEPYTFTEEMFNNMHPEFASRGNAACDWSITGFTTNGASSFKGYFKSVATYTTVVNAHIDYLEKSINGLIDAAIQAREDIMESVR